jgi:hypothetical protein
MIRKRCFSAEWSAVVSPVVVKRVVAVNCYADHQGVESFMLVCFLIPLTDLVIRQHLQAW